MLGKKKSPNIGIKLGVTDPNTTEAVAEYEAEVIAPNNTEAVKAYDAEVANDAVVKLTIPAPTAGRA